MLKMGVPGFDFIHDPSSVSELLNSTAEPKIPLVANGKVASKKELIEFEGNLKYPNIHLERYYLLYEKYTSCPIDKEKCNEYVAKMKELYALIKAAEDDDEKWLHWVTQVENEKFIRVNVENRLLKDMSNKKLWMLYIAYLKENNQKEMLRIYSHYCRQFSDDEELVREYWKAARSSNGLNPITVHFKTLFHFETHDVDLNGVEKENVPQDFNSIYAIQKKDDKPKLEIFFNPNNALVQSWPFKSPLMRYILLNANGTVLSKLHHSCKYFFIQRPLLP
uniref:Uncharacterized protein n=1 Tax=Panagrolaimus sp. ES5 TaxID=591445 RepID=A0AC34FR73_9BILA